MAGKKRKTKYDIEKKVVVVVIDSGIDTSVSNLKNYVIASTGFEISKNNYIIEKPSKPIVSAHGTAIALIIRQICKQVNIISVNILNENLSSDSRVLIYALDRVNELKPDIINLSVGTTKWIRKFAINKIVKKTTKNNTVIIASAHNKNRPCYPADLKRVIGVRGEKLSFYSDYYYKDNMFYAPYNADNIEGIELIKNSLGDGNSLACAYITGHAANIVHRLHLKNEKYVKHCLIKNSRKIKI